MVILTLWLISAMVRQAFSIVMPHLRHPINDELPPPEIQYDKETEGNCSTHAICQLGFAVSNAISAAKDEKCDDYVLYDGLSKIALEVCAGNLSLDVLSALNSQFRSAGHASHLPKHSKVQQCVQIDGAMQDIYSCAEAQLSNKKMPDGLRDAAISKHTGHRTEYGKPLEQGKLGIMNWCGINTPANGTSTSRPLPGWSFDTCRNGAYETICNRHYNVCNDMDKACLHHDFSWTASTIMGIPITACRSNLNFGAKALVPLESLLPCAIWDDNTGRAIIVSGLSPAAKNAAAASDDRSCHPNGCYLYDEGWQRVLRDELDCS